MGHQEACDFRCRKSDNSHYELQQQQKQQKQKNITNGVLIAMTVMVNVVITGRFTTGSGNKRKSRTS